MNYSKDPQLYLTDSGIRLVHLRQPAAGVGIFGIAVRAGSADEDADKMGLAHLVEHTIFKGTARRSSWHIINRMESVGGELNAYTTKEETVIYSIFPTGNAARAVELIADLASASRFPENQIEREREVVIDEIMSYYDTPSEAVFDDFEDHIFKGCPLGHNILGYPETVAKLTSEDCRNFLRRFYTKDNIVAFYTGNLSAFSVEKLLNRYLSSLPEESIRANRAPNTATPFAKIEKKHIHQAHVVRGIATEGLYSSSRYAIGLLANLTGGPGMNSLLNVELRERRGLVYSVETSTTLFSDTGLMTVYFGCDPGDVALCSELCNKTFSSIAAGELSQRRIEQAKKQYIGQLAIAAENRENAIMAAARATLFRGHPTPMADTVSAISDVTAHQLAQIAALATTPSSLIFTSDAE